MTTTTLTLASPIQRRLVLGAELRPEDPSTNWSLLSRLPDGTDPARFAAAVESVLGENRSFTESFEVTDDMDVVVRRTGVEHAVPVVRYATVDEIADRAGRLGDTVIDQSADRLFHAEVAVCGDDAYFLFAGAHAISDGFGYLQLTSDFATRYADPAAVLADVSSPADHVEPPLRPREDALEYFAGIFAGLDDLRVEGWGLRDDAGRIPGSITRHPMTGDLYQRAGELAKSLGVRRYSVLVASLAVVVSTMTQSDCVVISNPMSNRRSGPEAAGTRGARVNALPLRFDLGPDLTMADLCRSADFQISQLVEFEQHPFSEFARQLVRSDALDATTPSVGFTLYPRPLAVVVGDSAGEVVHVNRRFLQHALSLTVDVRDGCGALIIERADDLPECDIAEMYLHVLRGAVDSAGELSPGELDWDTPELTSLVGPDIEAFPATTMAAAFAAAAEGRPRDPAVVTDDEVLGFAELAAESDAIAAWLAAGTSEHVAVAMRPGPRMVAALLGVFKARRIYVPIDAANLSVRLPQIAAQCPGLTVLVDPGEVPATSPVDGVTVAAVPGDLRPPTGPLPQVEPDDCAYILFTSGTTGRPKGVRISHRSAARFYDGLQHATGIGRARWLMSHSISFDISLVEIFSALFAGGAVCVPGADVKRDPELLTEFVERHGVQVVSQTPSAFAMLADRLARVESVARIILCGERVEASAAAAFLRARPDVVVTNAYGITETTMYHTAFDLPADPAWLPERCAAGKPFADMSMMILDERLRLLPRGVEGQIAVRGAGLMLGYLDPKQTARAIVPVGGIPTYLSGDRGYVNEDRDFVVLGRADGQVKIRGHRCELGEIEHACHATGLVSAAHAAVVGTGLEAELVCFVVAAADADERTLRDGVARRLPRYAVPGEFVFVEALPTNTNGKVDRAELLRRREQERRPERGPRAGSAAGADGHVREAVTKAWRDVLGTNDFGPTTRFFEAGGTSATLLQVRERLRGALGIERIDVVDLFEHCTPDALAEHLVAQLPTQHTDQGDC